MSLTISKKYGSRIADLRHHWDSALERVRDEKALLQKTQQEVTDLSTAQKIAQEVAQTVQQQVHKRIASVVSRCLEAVFEEPYDFQILFEQKRGRTEARLVFVRDGKEIDPMSASGGGVVDVAAFALRTACLLLSRPPTRRIIVLDEPFKFVSAEYRPRVRQMLLSLAKDMNIQFIMVTHIAELQCGTVLEIGEAS